MEIKGNIFNVIESMYVHEKNRIGIGHKETDFFDVNIEVKQECILSPTLFDIFISALPELLNKNESEPATIGNIKVAIIL